MADILQELVSSVGAKKRWKIAGVAPTGIRIETTDSDSRGPMLMSQRIKRLKVLRNDIRKFAEHLQERFFAQGPYTGRDIRAMLPERAWKE